jgi:serine/threonine protein kinase
VWLAEKGSELRVFKFATDGFHLRALQREVTVFRVLQKALSKTPPWGIEIFGWNFEQEPFCIESEYAGSDLLRWSSSEEFLSMSTRERVHLAASVADAVAVAHSLSILHNDLKPTNILIAQRRQDDPADTERQRWQVKVIDFGVASLFDTQRLQEMDITDYGDDASDDNGRTSPVGTAVYRAPELHTGAPPTQQADVYSLGLLLYQIMTGDFLQPLAPGWEARIADALLRMDIAQAAEVDPALRLSSASELASRLRNLDDRRLKRQQAEAERLRAERNEELLTRARLRRPWVILAASILIVALCISWNLSRIAVRQRKLAEARSATISAMYEFVAQDFLGQSNPYLSAPGPAHGPQETLLEAIHTALPKIDSRFSTSPEIAGRLHVTVADAFKSRTQYVEADQEYLIAEQRFRLAEGPLSENAILTEFKRENAQLSSRLPGAVAAAQEEFKTQQALVAKLSKPSAELKAWNALIQASFIGFGERPQDALPILSEALRNAQATPGLDPALITTMKARICGLYVRLQDGPHLEQASRELREELAKRNGPDSPTLVLLDMYLQEALYLEGRYSDTIAMGQQNYTRFSRILGPQHELTLATLANRAGAEGELGDYEAALRDDLQLYTAERSNPSGRRLEQGSLADAAMYECHAGHFQSGIEHARQVIRESGSGPLAQPMFAEGARFTLAECLISKQQSEPDGSKTTELHEADRLLANFHLDQTDQMSGGTDYATWLNVARARLAFLQGDGQTARLLAAKELPALTQPGASLYERKAVEQLLAVLNQHSPI